MLASKAVAAERGVVPGARPRLSFNLLAFGGHGFYPALEHALRIGSPIAVHRFMLDQAGWHDAMRELRESGLVVSYVMHSAVVALDRPDAWGRQSDSFRQTMAAAAELGARQVCITSGQAGALSWEAAADTLAEVLAPLLAEATEAGLDVVMEPTGQLRQDIGFVHGLRDAVDLARWVGVGVCLDTFWCFRERGLFESMREAADLIRLVQITDNPTGKVEHGDRMVPGDGIADLAGVVRTLLDSGYDGWLDLEILGPRIADEGPTIAVDRGLARLAALLAAEVPS